MVLFLSFFSLGISYTANVILLSTPKSLKTLFTFFFFCFVYVNSTSLSSKSPFFISASSSLFFLSPLVYSSVIVYSYSMTSIWYFLTFFSLLKFLFCSFILLHGSVSIFMTITLNFLTHNLSLFQ